MKKFLRLLVKIIGTPIFIPCILTMIILGYFFIFFDWLYDHDEWEKRINRETNSYFLKMFKKWFTQI